MIFSTVFDDKTTYIKDDYEGLVYNNDENAVKAHKFIKKLMKDDLTTRGGQGNTRKKIKNKTIISINLCIVYLSKNNIHFIRK